MKIAFANFYLNLSLKAKDFTRAKREFHLASARFHISPSAKYFTAKPVTGFRTYICAHNWAVEYNAMVARRRLLLRCNSKRFFIFTTGLKR